MDISIVIPVYNEESNISQLVSQLLKVINPLNLIYEIIFINDGSEDSTELVIREHINLNKNIHLYSNAVNIGQEKSLLFGIKQAKGSKIICMDGDLQHPTSCIPLMIEKANSGNDAVCMIRKSSLTHNGIWHIMSFVFYLLLRKIKKRNIKSFSSDFFLLKKNLQIKISKNTIFIRGVLQEIAENPTFLIYNVEKRNSGKSKYSLLDKIKQGFQILTA